MIIARADRFYRNEIDAPISIKVNTQHSYLFDAATEQRISMSQAGD